MSDIFFTHGHGDHVAAAPLCPRARCTAALGDRDMMAKRGPVVPGFGRFMGLVLPVPAVTLTDAFVGRAEVPVGGGGTVLAVPFPGHTPGSMLYLYDGVLFAGDSMNFEKDKLTPAFAPFTVDTRQNRATWRRCPSASRSTRSRSCAPRTAAARPAAETRRMLDDLDQRARALVSARAEARR